MGKNELPSSRTVLIDDLQNSCDLTVRHKKGACMNIIVRNTFLLVLSRLLINLQFTFLRRVSKHFNWH